MKYFLLLFLLPVVAFAGGSHEVSHEKKYEKIVPPFYEEVPVSKPAVPSTVTPSNGGGWSGGCSTYADGQLPPWGTVPCVPTSPSQGPPVTPESLAKPPIGKNGIPYIPLSAVPYTGLNLNPFEYFIELLLGWLW